MLSAAESCPAIRIKAKTGAKSLLIIFFKVKDRVCDVSVFKNVECLLNNVFQSLICMLIP